jgi:hypothetical protein
MRDRSSSYWFTVGDTVAVVEDVWSGTGGARHNFKGRTGRVVETWEKCDVDPTCCCAEQVDTDMAVRVVFGDGDSGNDDDDTDAAGNAGDNTTNTTNTEDDTTNDDTTNGDKRTKASTAYYYYFAEDELVKL